MNGHQTNEQEVILLKAQVLAEFLKCEEPFRTPEGAVLPWNYRKRLSKPGSSPYCSTKEELKQVYELILDVIRQKIGSIMTDTAIFRSAKRKLEASSQPRSVSAADSQKHSSILENLGTFEARDEAEVEQMFTGQCCG